MKDNSSVGYNKISRIYDVSRAANAETVEKLVRLLHASSESMLLDLGCGTGNYTAALQQVTQSVLGIDMSIGMIKQARAKFPELQLVCGDVTNIPFDSETFDGAFTIQVLHHVKKKDTFLREAHRVLRKDGYLAVDSCSHKQMRAFWYYHYFPKGLEADLTRIPDSDRIVSLLERAGFSDVGIEICYTDVGVAYETPECYLDKNYRDSISTFTFMKKKDIQSGCEKLQHDITSGATKKIVSQAEAKVAKAGGSSIIFGRKGS